MPVTEPKEIWFARRYPLGSGRGGMAPVHWKGWAVVAGFVVGLLIAGVGFALFAQTGDMAKGAWTFVVLAGGAALWLIRMANHNGDHINTIADYEKGKLTCSK